VSAPRRVGLVCPYSLDVRGGVQSHVLDLAEVLSGRRHQVGVLAPGDGALALPSYVTLTGGAMPVPFNGSVARVSFGPRAVARVRRWLAEGRFDLLHVHEPSAPSLSLLALWASDVPVVATFHSAMARSRVMSSTVAMLRPAMEKISARIAVSEAARATLVQHVGGEPVVVPNGLRWERFAGARPRREWQEPGPTVAFLGRIDEPRKGLEVVLAAFPAVLSRHPEARLLVAGRGDPAQWRAQTAGFEHSVSFLGQVGDGDKAALMASAPVFVAPQLGGESFGIVLLEALAAGASVVASDLPAFRALLRDGDLGALFPPGDPAALARAACVLLEDPDRRTLLARRGREAARRYDWGALVGDVEAVYDAVLTAPRVVSR
jgi:phosphatidyl-myo-inositol alpha-mannosyltransferase